MNDIILSNGVSMPSIGYGTWKLNTGGQCVDTIKQALNVGYRHLDCAYSYGNDFFVGKALRQSGINRDKVFITNKLWRNIAGYDNVVSACKKSLKLMKLDYFDLYLIHWPVPISEDGWQEKNANIWSAMVSLYNEGLIRAVGVSNFLQHHLEAIRCAGDIIQPMVNQIERHPGFAQNEVIRYCSENDIRVQAWSPLGSGHISVNPYLYDIAEKYGCSSSQIALIWNLQRGITPICRAQSVSHMEENLLLPDITISSEEIELLDTVTGIQSSGFHPDYNPAQ